MSIMEEALKFISKAETLLLSDKLTIVLLVCIFWFSVLSFYIIKKLWDIEEESYEAHAHLSEQVYEVSQKFKILVESLGGIWEEEKEPEHEQK